MPKFRPFLAFKIEVIFYGELNIKEEIAVKIWLELMYCTVLDLILTTMCFCMFSFMEHFNVKYIQKHYEKQKNIFPLFPLFREIL